MFSKFQELEENSDTNTNDDDRDEYYIPEELSDEDSIDEGGQYESEKEEFACTSRIIKKKNEHKISQEDLRLSRELKIDRVETERDKCKKYFCKFCNKLICKFVRHLEVLHKEERKVRDILLLPKGKQLNNNGIYSKFILLNVVRCKYYAISLNSECLQF